MSLFPSFFMKPRPIPTVEQWATHNAKKASPDGMIAAAIVESFAKDFKHWKFVGKLEQNTSGRRLFEATSLSRKVPGKKHVEIIFVFRERVSGEYKDKYNYVPSGCEVNGIRLEDKAFRYILKSWKDLVVQVQKTQEVAAQAEAAMKANEAKWDLAEALNGFGRDKKGALKPLKTYDDSGTLMTLSAEA